MTARSPLRRELAIDDFAPRFCDLFHLGVSHVNERTYMEPAMRDYAPHASKSQPNCKLDELDKHVAMTVCAMATEPSFPTHVEEAVAEASTRDEWFVPPPLGAGTRSHALDTTIVGPAFFPEVERKGIVLIELCGGIATMLQALLKAGVRIQRYYYVDNDPVARQLVGHLLPKLSAQYPGQLPMSGHAQAFNLPQDLREVTRDHMRETMIWDDTPYLVTTGWPCQEYSPAGHGQIGERAALLDDVT